MNRWCSIQTLIALPLIATGCQREWHQRDFDVPATAESTEVVDSLANVGGISDGATLADAVEAARARGLVNQVECQSIDLSLAQARADAISNNLALKAQLYQPRIGVTQITEAEARFEAVLFGSWSHSDESFLSSLEDGTPTTSDAFQVGARIPLVTGGTLEVTTLSNHVSDITPLLAEPWESGFSIDIRQPLLRDAGVEVNTASIRLARLGAQTIDAQTKLELIRLLSNVERAYWGLYKTTRQLAVRVKQFEVAKAQVERARRRVDAGDAPAVDLLRAESGLGATLESVIVADNLVRVTQRDLKVLLNREDLPQAGETAINITEPPVPVEPKIDAAILVARAMAGRMELLEQELNLAQDAERIMIARNGMLPSFVLDYNYQILGDGTSIGNAYGAIPDADNYTLSVAAEIPIGNEAARSRLSRSLLTRLQRLATRDARQQSITNEVLDTVDTLRNTWQRIVAAKLETELAARTLAGEERQFEVGLRTSTDVLDAATRLADAQSREVDALSSYQIVLVDLAFATGTTLGAQHVDVPDISDADAKAAQE